MVSGLLITLSLILPPRPARPAEGLGVPEYKAKAALLYHFALLTEWPAPAKDPFRICTVGRDPFGPHLTPLTEKSLHGRPIEVHRHEYWSQAAACDVVFVARRFAAGASKPWQRPSPGVLTLSDAPGFAREGGIIELTLQGDRIRFDVNLRAAARNGLRFSSRMLGLAREVIR
jgi:hypothetical protein